MDLKLQQPQIPLSIRQSFTNKTVFIIGATGFLGKVWLTQLLAQVQTFRKMYILIRGKGSQSGRERFENLINSSFVFEHLHQKFKYELSNYLRDKVEIIEGDVSFDNFGLTDSAIKKLQKEVDLTINFAGLVDFNPELSDAFLINVQGTVHVADFVQKCKNKKLVHISTCYVAGTRQGNIEEKVVTDRSPNDKPLNIEFELQWINSNIDKTTKKLESQEQIDQLQKMIQERNIELNKEPYSDKKISKTIDNMKRKKLRNALMDLGTTRAKDLGWTNTYTYTKGLAEIVLQQRYPSIELVIFRPSIVESSLSFPFAGWNEGFNTSGPLAYLMKSWFRHLPLKKGNPFDVIPVDYVARGLSIASAALLEGKHEKVYHCSTSDNNRLTIDQACQYTSDSHSVYYREHGSDWRERVILSRWKTIPSRKDHPLSTSNFKKFFTTFEKITSKAKTSAGPFKFLFQKPHAWALRTNRKLEQIEKLLDLFYPFIHDYRHIFKTQSLFKYDVKEPELEFFSIRKVNWEDYWKNVQMPGLRKWCFPAIEARGIEKFKPSHPISLSTSKVNGNGKHTNDAQESIPTRFESIPANVNFQDNSIEEKKVIE
jgi:nucleoside-diphosphate-sugar epimerase